jgi:hypothetical protein
MSTAGDRMRRYVVPVAEKSASEVEREVPDQGGVLEMAGGVAESHVEAISGAPTQSWCFAADRSRALFSNRNYVFGEPVYPAYRLGGRRIPPFPR